MRPEKGDCLNFASQKAKEHQNYSFINTEVSTLGVLNVTFHLATSLFKLSLQHEH